MTRGVGRLVPERQGELHEKVGEVSAEHDPVTRAGAGIVGDGLQRTGCGHRRDDLRELRVPPESQDARPAWG
jgi:hypothetical protein